MILYQQLAPYYFDIEKPGRHIQKEFDFLQSEFKKYRVKRVLDAGCGSGEHVAHLNNLGFEACGVDNSEAMLKVARERFPFSKGKYYLDSMNRFRDAEKFDAVISMWGSFNYLVSDKEVYAALRNFHTLLNPGGVIILEVWHATPLVTIKRKPMSSVARVISNEQVIQRNRGFRLLKKDDEVVVEVNYIYKVGNREYKDRHVMRAWYMKEIQDVIKKAGFSMQRVFGSMDRTRLTDTSSRLIFIAQKPA